MNDTTPLPCATDGLPILYPRSLILLGNRLIFFRRAKVIFQFPGASCLYIQQEVPEMTLGTFNLTGLGYVLLTAWLIAAFITSFIGFLCQGTVCPLTIFFSMVLNAAL